MKIIALHKIVEEDIKPKRIFGDKFREYDCPFCIDGEITVNIDKGLFQCDLCKGGNAMAYFMGFGFTFPEAILECEKRL